MASTKGAISTASFIVGAAPVAAEIVMIGIPTAVQQRASAMMVHPWAGRGGGGLGVAGAF